MDNFSIILVIMAIAFAVLYGGRALFESEESRAARIAERIIEKRKARAREKGFTRRAIFVAKQLGERERDGWYVFKDSALHIVADHDSVGIKQVSSGVLVFKAHYSDIPFYEYDTGTSLERRDDGGYDVKHETATGGGFSDEILGYIPGEWEEHLGSLGWKAERKCKSERLQQERTEKEEQRKSFGI